MHNHKGRKLMGLELQINEQFKISELKENLKEQYITIAEIMLKNHPEFKIVENYKRPYCNIDEECDEPYSEKNCSNCKEQMYEIYDIAILEACDGINYKTEYELIQFHESEYHKCVLTDKQMYHEIKKLNNILHGRTVNLYRYYLDPYRKIEKLKTYAKDFLRIVKDDFNLILDEEMLPINIYLEDEDDEEDEDEEEIEGTFCTNRVNRQLMIKIYCLKDDEYEDEDEVLRTIRHEVLHYLLYCGYLKHKDNAGVFWALCEIYDAGAYEEMNTKEQKLYDDFMYIYQNIDDLIQRLDFKESKKMLLHYMLRYIGHIPWNVNQDFLDYAEPLYLKLLSKSIDNLPVKFQSKIA